MKSKRTIKKKSTPKKAAKPESEQKTGGAPKGNSFWKLRAKHGRDKLFETPELMLEAAEEYFTWCDENPWYKNEAIKSGENAGTIINVPTQRPYTLSGFLLFCGASEGYLRTFKLTNKSEDFLSVITHIEEHIATQQLEGATVGAFNANIIARKLGLTDKKDITTDGESLNKGYYDFLRAKRTKKSE